MRNGVEKWVWIMDMKEYSSSTSPPFSVTKATMAILANHYPERLHRVYIGTCCVDQPPAPMPQT